MSGYLTPYSVRHTPARVIRAAGAIGGYAASRAGQYIANRTAKFIANRAKKAFGGNDGSGGQGSGSAGGATTAAFPTAKKNFRRKRMSKRKRRFQKAVRRVIQGQTAYQTVLRNPHVATPLTISCAGNAQATNVVSIWGINGTTGTHDDVYSFFNNSYNASPGAIGAANEIDEASMYLYNATLSVNMVNTQTGNVADIDIYHLKCVKDVPVTMITSGATDIGNFFNLCVSATTNTGIVGTATLNSAIPGVTPFTNPQFSKYFTCIAQQKIFLKPGESADFTKNYRLFKKIHGRNVLNPTGSANLLAKAGLTHAMLFVVNNVGWVATEPGKPLSIYTVKRYKIKNNSGSQVPGLGLA